MDNRSIGIFDSGLGGLTAARALIGLLPREDIVFLGDTARIPYGDNDVPTILRYAKEDIGFLAAKNVKIILAACGTVSSNITEEVKAGSPVPFVGVLDPTVEAAVRKTANGRIGIIATEATVRSGAFQRKLLEKDPNIQVTAVGCPKLVPLIEGGRTSPECSDTMEAVKEYMAPILENGCDTLILGCTHYPLIEHFIERISDRQLNFINAGEEATALISDILRDKDAFADRKGKGSQRFCVTSDPGRFARLAQIFLNRDISEQVTLEPWPKTF